MKTFLTLLQIPFQFEKRDWMSVDVAELPDGSELVRQLIVSLQSKSCFDMYWIFIYLPHHVFRGTDYGP